MARSLMAQALRLVCVLGLCAGAALAQLPAQLPAQQGPATAKVTPLVVPPAAKALFNRPFVGFTASYYGGQTDGGSCGYGSAQESGYGVFTASASTPIYLGGAACGACYTMSCAGSGLCLPGVTPSLTVTNLCTAASGPCAGNKRSFSLAPAVWNRIAVNPNIGIVPVRLTRVPCLRAGGVSFKVIVGNPYYVQVLISNVAGSGDLLRAEVNVQGTNTWVPMKRDNGAVWSFAGTDLGGKAFSFRLTSGYYRETIIVRNAIPAIFEPGRTFPSTVNFKLAPPPVAPRKAMEQESFNATVYVSN